MHYTKGFVEIGTSSNFLQRTEVGGSHISEKQKFSNVRNSTKSVKIPFIHFAFMDSNWEVGP